MVTYKKNVSLYVGDQLLFFDLVECLRFFPLRLGPTIFTSTNGRNIVPVKKKRHNRTLQVNSAKICYTKAHTFPENELREDNSPIPINYI